MATVADLGILPAGGFDGVGPEVIDPVAVGADGGGQVRQELPKASLCSGQGPGRPMSWTGIWPWHLRQVVSGLTCLRR